MIENNLRISEILAKKEMLLNDIIVWLKAKGLYEQCMYDCNWTITTPNQVEMTLDLKNLPKLEPEILLHNGPEREE